ncbi:phosphonate ABC transporter, permease protein PhnE [Phytoactinopolyspora limicola]|uniref:phosphonate ABC transporter, permease protein PhnE n=1 Tax=Phytoactinopolyspora limicola TaxID=2715536 RepID=UPI00140763E2|nr:phosphonate ABC transporter, permease protein PhnE [Phytoactinopolyspora limicola]
MNEPDSAPGAELSTAAADRPRTERPKKPRPSLFMLGGLIGLAAVTIAAGADWRFGVGFSLTEIWDGLTRPNAPMRGLGEIDFGVLTGTRARNGFLETLQMALVSTISGALVALPLALFNSKLGAPNRIAYAAIKLFNNVIRSIPDLLWALLFVAAVGIGALPGMLALFFFSIGVVTKLTSDTIDGIDHGPVEAARASGASHLQMLRTAVFPQVLPAYTSFSMYCFELNLRASAVLGFVGAGGIGAVINDYRISGQWDRVWGVVVGFLIVVIVVERISMMLRRRLL